MRKSASLLIPITMITLYYVAGLALFLTVANLFPELKEYLPIGGVHKLAETDAFGEVTITGGEAPPFLVDDAPIKLAIACIGTVALMIPVSWVYLITNSTKEIDASFVQTIVTLPVVVAGIAMVVQNSLALAFSLAGIVAAVRFRFTLDLPSHALYIFTAIGVGLGAGIGALGVASVISAGFVYTSLAFWKIEYGHRAAGPFLSILTRRSREEDG